MPQVDYDALARKFGATDAPDYDALAKQFGSIEAPEASTPDPRGLGASSGPSMRAGAQVLAPKNPRAVVDALVDAGNVVSALPRAAASVAGDYAVGAAKGLGGMADSAIKAMGLPRSDYAETAFEPSNPVQSVGSGAAQIGTGLVAGEAALGAMGLSPITAFIAKFLMSPGGAGTVATGTELARGKDLESAVTTGVAVGGLSKVAPSVISKIVSKVFPKASASEIATATQEAVEIASKPKFNPKLTPEEMRAAIEAGPRGNAAKRAAAALRPIPPNKLPPVLPDPVVPEIAVARSEGGSLWDTKTGKPIKLSAEEAKAAVANLPWNKAKAAKIIPKAEAVTVRLYRVEPKDLGDKGEWLKGKISDAQFAQFRSERGRLFSNDPKALENYGFGSKDHNSFYVDVPKDAADAMKRAHPDGFSEYLVPEDIVKLKRNIAKAKASDIPASVPVSGTGAKIPALATMKPELVDRIGTAISPDAAWKDLRKHGAGDGKPIPSKEAREMVDLVWKDRDPGYTSIEQWMADRRDRWDAMRTSSKKAKKGN